MATREQVRDETHADEEPWFIRQARTGRMDFGGNVVALRAPREDDVLPMRMPEPRPGDLTALEPLPAEQFRVARGGAGIGRSLRAPVLPILIALLALLAVGGAWWLANALRAPAQAPRPAPRAMAPAVVAPPVPEPVASSEPSLVFDDQPPPEAASATPVAPADVAPITTPEPARRLIDVPVPAEPRIQRRVAAPARERAPAAAVPMAAPVAAAPATATPRADSDRFADRELAALERDLADVSARVAATGDERTLRRLAKGEARFAERVERCRDDDCLAGRYRDRLEDVAALQAKRGTLPECLGFQVYRPTVPCVARP